MNLATAEIYMHQYLKQKKDINICRHILQIIHDKHINDTKCHIFEASYDSVLHVHDKDDDENEERMKELELTPDMYCYNFIQMIVNTDSEDNNQIF